MSRSVRISIKHETLLRLQYGVADIACWLKGYRAGNPDNPNLPDGMEEITELNILLKRALDNHDALADVPPKTPEA